MEFDEAGRYWEANAEVWTLLARAGCDVYRDHLNTPAFLDLLPDVRGLRGIDLGCGEGHNTRLLAGCGASMCGIDIAPSFVRYAAGLPEPPVSYALASAHCLPFAGAYFDFAVACMSLMDMPRPEAVLAETVRVLKPAGFLQFSITHPCSNPPHRRQIKDADGQPVALETARYFERVEWIDEWIFRFAPGQAKEGLRKFRIPLVHRTLADWFNMVTDAGLRIERVSEPTASDEVLEKYPKLADTRLAPYFLHVRCRKG